MAGQKPGLLARIASPEPAPPWSVGAALLSMLAAFIAVVVAVGFVQTWLGETSATLLIAWTLAALLMTVFVFQSRRTPVERQALRLGPPRLALPLLLALNIGLAMLLDLLNLGVTGQFLPLPELLNLSQSPGDTTAWVFAALLLVVAQPVGEGLIFFGIGQPALRAAFGPWPGLIVTALAYGAFHLAAYTPGYLDVPQSTALWYGLVVPVLDGLIFALNRAAAGSTRAAIVAHAAFGLFAVIRTFLILR